MTTRFRHASLLAVAGVVTGMLVAVQGAAQAAGTTYFVNSSAACSDSNPGTSSAAPLCSISAGAKKAGSGDTVQVAAGTYREQVTATASGVTFNGSSQAQVVGSGTVGTAWTQSGNTWSTQPGWPVSPAAVTNNGTTLTKAATAAAVDTTANSWFWAASTATLLVNTGGSPGTVDVTWTYGFLVRGLNGVTINGFTVTGQTGAGILLDSTHPLAPATPTPTTNSTVANSTVSGSGGYGISDSGGSNNTITGVHTTGNTSIGILVQKATGDVVSSSKSDNNGFHGVSVQGGSGNVVRTTTTFANLKPGTRVAAGIDVSGSSSNALVERNTTYGNDDSGIEIYTGSTGAVVRDNLSYDNNDHGIDISKAPNSTVVSNTVVGNATSGINVEGGSTGTVVRDNIAVGNTVDLTRSVGDIRVDGASIPGTTLDHDLVFETASSAAPIFEWNGVNYSNFQTFRTATQQEAHGLAADPGFVSLSSRDLRLTGTSPAIDAGDSTVAGWKGSDHDGVAPVDDPKVADKGKGSPSFADLGALEFTGAVALPPTTSVASKDGLTIDVDASNSGTLGETPTGRTIDCGNGQAPIAGSSAQCVYPATGGYTVTVMVTGKSVNGHSWSDSASTQVTAQQDSPPVATLTLSRGTIGTAGSVTANASGSTDDHGIASYAFSCGNSTGRPAGSAATATCKYSRAGVYTVKVTVTDTGGQSSTARRTVTVVPPPSARLSLSRARIHKGQSTIATAGASTSSRASRIDGYRFNCGNGHRTAWATSSRTTCHYRHTGRFTVKVWVRNTVGLVDTATRVVRVRR